VLKGRRISQEAAEVHSPRSAIDRFAQIDPAATVDEAASLAAATVRQGIESGLVATFSLEVTLRRCPWMHARAATHLISDEIPRGEKHE
jgi:hypothetical protein